MSLSNQRTRSTTESFTIHGDESCELNIRNPLKAHGGRISYRVGDTVPDNWNCETTPSPHIQNRARHPDIRRFPSFAYRPKKVRVLYHNALSPVNADGEKTAENPQAFGGALRVRKVVHSECEKLLTASESKNA